MAKHKKGTLTQAQKKFVIEAASGKARSEAYAAAYPAAATWKVESRQVAAAHLMAEPHVARAYKEELARIHPTALCALRCFLLVFGQHLLLLLTIISLKYLFVK